jgi:UDP-N-acetylglucosamine/UDP-N-acetylgalactosamine 4-epimerase
MTSAALLETLRQSADTKRLWLVTGAAGFIGSNIVETLLSAGEAVRAVDNFATGHQYNIDEVVSAVGGENGSRFDFRATDIRDGAGMDRAMAGVTHVLHQAALGSVPRSIADPLTTNDVNITGFLTTLDCARRANVERFVYAASSSTYGDEPNLPKIESRIGRPLSPYALTKFANELYADVYARTYGRAATGLRYFNVFGKRQDPEGAYAAVIPKWIKAMLSDESVTINGDGETSRDFCFVENAVQANILAALKQQPSVADVFNVAVGERTSLNQLFQMLVDSLRENGTDYRKPAEFAPFRAGDVRHSQADISHAMNALGYVPTHDLKAGLKAAMPWYKTFLSPLLDENTGTQSYA